MAEAEHDHHFGAGFDHLVDGARQCRLFVRHTPFGNNGRAGRLQARGGDLERLLDYFRRQARQQRRDDADLANRIGRDPDDRLRLGRSRHSGVTCLRRYRERDDLNGGDHLAFDHRLEQRQGGERYRLVDAVDPVDGIFVDHQHARGFGKQIAAAGKGAVGARARTGNRRGDIGGGLVLRHIAGLQPRHDDLLDAGGVERGDMRRPDQRALLEHEIALTDRVHRRRANRVVGSDRTEFHAVSFSAVIPGRGRSARTRNPEAHTVCPWFWIPGPVLRTVPE
jgi:hypothetical protein